jgi:hypothetical protein
VVKRSARACSRAGGFGRAGAGRATVACARRVRKRASRRGSQSPRAAAPQKVSRARDRRPAPVRPTACSRARRCPARRAPRRASRGAPGAAPPYCSAASRAIATASCASAPRRAPEPSASPGDGFSTAAPAAGAPRLSPHRCCDRPRASVQYHHAYELQPAQARADGLPRRSGSKAQLGAPTWWPAPRRRFRLPMRGPRRVATADARAGAARCVPTGRCAAAGG